MQYNHDGTHTHAPQTTFYAVFANDAMNRSEWAKFFASYPHFPEDIPAGRLWPITTADIPKCTYRLGDHASIHEHR
eukprot:1619846-Pleurochrysis_carterae.AAC.1